MAKKTFYFNDVDVKGEENPGELLDFELEAANILKLSVDGTKNVERSSISLNKKNITFPDKIIWDIYSDSLNRITLHVEILDEQNKLLNSFWLALRPLSNNQVIFKGIPEKTNKIIITCFRDNVINKSGNLTITSKN